jgi:hypothetical protein
MHNLQDGCDFRESYHPASRQRNRLGCPHQAAGDTGESDWFLAKGAELIGCHRSLNID